MITRARKLVIALCFAGSIDGIVFCQEYGQAGADQQPQSSADEEVIVRGRSRGMLRIQIELAEQALYDRFNEINSNDDFDISCREEVFTGSRIPHRICRANFWRKAEARAGRETTRAMQGSGFTIDAKQFQSEALYKSDLLADEMRRLAKEDKQLGQAALHLAELQQAMADDEEPAAWSGASSEHVVTAAEQPLPYDAAVMADVRIGGEPWSHVLTQRTFTIANVFGEIGAIDAECDAHTQRLRYEPGEEWTLPDGWGACTVVVEALPSTTFSLFEFE